MRESGELRRQRLSGRRSEVCGFVAGLPGPVRATYEAGPTGFALARAAAGGGRRVLVCAPGVIPRGPSIGSRPTGATPSSSRGC